jgi:hypothetical protein
MVDIFEKELCNYCKKTQCIRKIIKKQSNNVITLKCEEYEKDESKIIPYEPPLIVTAKRDYIIKKEI